ncbi:unnamed protein product [Callosobruchus maculatus]|uniref:Uncharacterized protein n=1 Tax=Callosobruchus maculatus TaxID=64391 RepID=A0A653DU49_CALMS|nr:unnamed protein product [Callosobruchus maculatus]
MRTPLTLPANRGACGKLRANHASTAGLRAPIPTSRNFIEIVWEARILFTGYYVVNFFCEYCADREVCVTALPRQDKAVLLLLAPGAFAYSYPSAIYGTNRYGHTPRRLRAYEAPAYPSYQAPVVAPRYPLSYYKVYPYSDTYTQQDDSYYYPQETASYPLYYPRTSKYEVYQAVLPYYTVRHPIWHNLRLRPSSGTSG